MSIGRRNERRNADSHSVCDAKERVEARVGDGSFDITDGGTRELRFCREGLLRHAQPRACDRDLDAIPLSSKRMRSSASSSTSLLCIMSASSRLCARSSGGQSHCSEATIVQAHRKHTSKTCRVVPKTLSIDNPHLSILRKRSILYDVLSSDGAPWSPRPAGTARRPLARVAVSAPNERGDCSTADAIDWCRVASHTARDLAASRLRNPNGGAWTQTISA